MVSGVSMLKGRWYKQAYYCMCGFKLIDSSLIKRRNKIDPAFIIKHLSECRAYQLMLGYRVKEME
jgi:hypothetical protein